MSTYLTTADPNGRFTEPAGSEYIDLNSRKQYRQQRNPSGSTWLVIKENVKVEYGSAYWGKILGSISDQTDLSDALNSKVNLAGGTMTGLLKLSGDPTDPFGAATKQYVDAAALADLALGSGKIFVGNGSNLATGVDLSLNPTGGTFGLDNTGKLTFPNADTTTRGLLLAADWTTFNGKEPAITAGTTAQYWRGDKTFQDLATAVRATALTGFSVGSNSTILATDTILQAFGKAQAQINALPTGSGTTNRITYWTSATALGAVSPITAGYVMFAASNGLPTFDAGYLNYDSTNHRLLYGQTSGSSIIDFVNMTTSDIRGLTMRQYTSDSLGARVNMFKANASGGVITSGWTLGTFSAWGHDGTQFIESGSIKIVSNGTIGTNRMPSQLDFYISSDITTSVLTNVASIKYNGTTPEFVIKGANVSKLVIQSATTGTNALMVQNYRDSIGTDIWGIGKGSTSNNQFQFVPSSVNDSTHYVRLYRTALVISSSSSTGLTAYGGIGMSIQDAAPASVNYGLINLGTGTFDGATSDYFGKSGSSTSAGTMIAGNILSTTADWLNLQVSGVTKLRVLNSGALGIGIAPTANLHLRAGTATANTAPLKLTQTSAVLLTSAEAGAFENDTEGGLYYTDKTPVRRYIPQAFSNRATAQTAAKTLTAYTVTGNDGSFAVAANVNVTAATLCSFTVTCTYTDETNTSQTLTLTFSQTTGSFLNTITNATGTGVYEGVFISIRAKAGTTITIASTGTFTTVTYNIEGIITQTA